MIHLKKPDRIAIVLIFMFILLLTVSLSRGEQSVIQIPVKLETQYTKRIPGIMEFVIIGYDPQGKLFAVPESEMQRFYNLAASLELSPLEIPFMGPGVAMSNVATVTITVEHETELSFWDAWDSRFITWGDLPVPVATVNDIEVAWMPTPAIPLPPSMTISEP